MENLMAYRTEKMVELSLARIDASTERTEVQLDDADTIQAELLFNQANSDLDTQLILETLAEILLNQQGV